MTPSAQSLPMGSLSMTHDRQLPGAPVPGGCNYQTGFGLFPGFEFVGRLATNNLGCNMFAAGACPSGTIRDFSASAKWQLPLPWDERRWPSLAIGATDLGGAATFFRSYYAVASHRWRDFRFSLGKADAQVPSAPLHGVFGSIQYSPFHWFNLSAEQIDRNRWLSARFQWTFTSSNYAATPYFYLTRSLREQELSERQWFGFGVNIPLGSGVWGALYHGKSATHTRRVQRIDAAEFGAVLKARGFTKFMRGQTSERVVLRVENAAFHWNLLDAFGNALGAMVAAFGESNRKFRLEVTQRDVVVAVLEGEMDCAERLLNEGRLCLNSDSLRFLNPTEFGHDAVHWIEKSDFILRPELIVSPSITTGLGTEFGAIDIASAVNFNWIIPLWPGANYDWNRITPFSAIESEEFSPGKPFYNLRFIPNTNRKLFHQIVPIYPLSTVVKGSVGVINSFWQGWQIESATYLAEGQHRIGLLNAQFKYIPFPNLVTPREPHLLSWRYSPKQLDFYSTEIQTGQFWSGDKGYVLTQRFWYGDTSVALYIRRSRMSEREPKVSFAGFQIQIPLTLRSQAGFQYLGLRGTNQWSYSAESKILEKDNRITPGYGIVPRVGDGLTQWLNRDRIGSEYLNSQMPRLSEAYWSNDP